MNDLSKQILNEEKNLALINEQILRTEHKKGPQINLWHDAC